MSTATENKHTPGALRAAKAINEFLASCFEKANDQHIAARLRNEETASYFALIIDRETAAPAMLEALEQIVYDKQHSGVIPCPQDWEFYIKPWQEIAKAAVRLAKGD